MEPDSHISRLTRLSSIARAVWSGNCKLMDTLRFKSELARSLLTPSSKGPTLSDPSYFEELFREAKAAHIKGELDDATSQLTSDRLNIMSRAKLNGKLEHLDRQASLWITQAPRLRLGGIRVTPQEATELGISGELRDEHVLISKPEDIAKGLAGVWKRTFGTKRNVSKKTIERMLRDYIVKWDWSIAEPITLEMLVNILAKSRNCAPGIDGTPNACWLNGGEWATDYLMKLIDAFLCKEKIPQGLNHLLFCFPPKPSGGPSAQNEDKVFKHPSETRFFR